MQIHTQRDTPNSKHVLNKTDMFLETKKQIYRD